MFKAIRSAIQALAAVALLAFTSAMGAETPKQLYWEDLVPAPPMNKKDHPFRKLDPSVLNDIQAIIWAEMQVKSGSIDKEDETYVLAMRLKQLLVSKGIDVDGLLKTYDRIEKQIREAKLAVVKDLDGKIVRMPGYALPLEASKEGIREFLLVPYVGACIHTPPPPANQMIYVTTDIPYKLKGLYDPVFVTGKMATQAASRRLNFVDGARAVDTGYALKATSIELYRR